MRVHTSFCTLALTLACFVACDSTPDADGRFTAAQDIIDELATKHAVERLTLHAIPEGASQAMYIASTDAARVGRASDPEDVTAIASGTSTVLREGDHFDITVPIQDASGKTVAAGGITLAAEDEEQARRKAEQIAAELQTAVQSAPSPLW